MGIEERSLHRRLQEYCDCYLEADLKEELTQVNQEGVAGDMTQDVEEVALKFLGLAILYGIEERLKGISSTKQPEGAVSVQIEPAVDFSIPAPPLEVGDKIFEIMRSITHLEGKEAKEPLVLGIKNDQIELQVAFGVEREKQVLSITFSSV